MAVVAGWLAFAAIIGLIVWGLLHYQQAITGVWPQVGPIYRAFGVSVNTNGLAFSDVNYRRDTEAGQLVLTIRGTVVNADSRPTALPRIEVILTDSQRHRMDSWVFSAGTRRLEPGQRITFTTRRINPPEQARHLEMVFVRRKR
ncbi:MAG: DUF3426 domain-containing protein [Alphaproteobacteria bacterium]|jgi:hypothetical protein